MACNFINFLKDMPKKKHHQDRNGVHPRDGPVHLPPDTNTFIPNSSPDGSTGSLDKTPFMCAPVTPQRVPPSSTPISSPVGTWNVSLFLNNYDELFIDLFSF